MQNFTKTIKEQIEKIKKNSERNSILGTKETKSSKTPIFSRIFTVTSKQSQVLMHSHYMYTHDNENRMDILLSVCFENKEMVDAIFFVSKSFLSKINCLLIN